MSEVVFIYTRSLEIVIAILAGAFLCYLGSRLFQFGFSEKSDLKLEYGTLKLHLFKASPGIFFCLFGAAIIFGTFWRSATFSEEFQIKGGVQQKRSIEKSIEDNFSDTDNLGIEKKFQNAVNLHRSGKIEQAEVIYQEILTSIPIIGQVANNLADIQKDRGEADKALIYATYATFVFPDSAIFQKTFRQVRELQEKK